MEKKEVLSIKTRMSPDELGRYTRGKKQSDELDKLKGKK
jgi:hypothetical protein